MEFPVQRTYLINLKKAAVSFCGACGVEVPDMIVGNVSESFQSDLLNVEFNRLDLRTEPNPEAADDKGPPSKRRKISEATTSLDKVVSALFSVLGNQEATDLYGLYQVAE